MQAFSPSLPASQYQLSSISFFYRQIKSFMPCIMLCIMLRSPRASTPSALPPGLFYTPFIPPAAPAEERRLARGKGRIDAAPRRFEREPPSILPAAPAGNKELDFRQFRSLETADGLPSPARGGWTINADFGQNSKHFTLQSAFISVNRRLIPQLYKKGETQVRIIIRAQASSAGGAAGP